jgi:hypothetical protein
MTSNATTQGPAASKGGCCGGSARDKHAGYFADACEGHSVDRQGRQQASQSPQSRLICPGETATNFGNPSERTAHCGSDFQ